MSRRITYQGETRTLSEWADHLGISRTAMWERLNRWGEDHPRAFAARGANTGKNGQELQITWNGETRTLRGWAQALGLSAPAMWERYHRWYEEDPERCFAPRRGSA